MEEKNKLGSRHTTEMKLQAPNRLDSRSSSVGKLAPYVKLDSKFDDPSTQWKSVYPFDLHQERFLSRKVG